MPSQLPLVAIAGPTAVGKSALLYRLITELEQAGTRCEVINGDSIQHYRGLDIGSDKPSASVRVRYRHHLIDVLDPDESCSLVNFVEQARQAAAEITDRGHLPVVCGGSVYFILHLLRGLPSTPPPDPQLRKRLQQRADEDDALGNTRLYDELARIDPVTSARLHPHDRLRIIRALEVYYVSGKTPPSHFPRFPTTPPPLCSLCIPLAAPRPLLRTRVTARLAKMYAAGLTAEVAGLVGRGYGADAPGLRAIGYRQFFDADGRLRPFDSAAERAQIVDETIRATMRYAKHQLTFLHQLPAARSYQPDEYPCILRTVRTFLGYRAVQTARARYDSR